MMSKFDIDERTTGGDLPETVHYSHGRVRKISTAINVLFVFPCVRDMSIKHQIVRLIVCAEYN